MDTISVKGKSFLKEIGGKLVDISQYGPRRIFENQKERSFYLEVNNPSLSIPVLRGYAEKAEEEAFRKADYTDNTIYRRSGFAKEAVKALSLIKEIIRQTDDNLSRDVNEKIISIGDKANKSREEYALNDVQGGIDFSAVPFAYNSADRTLERKVETAEAVIKGVFEYIPDFEKNLLALYEDVGDEKSAIRIAEALNKQYLKPIEEFEHRRYFQESLERILKITKALHEKREDLFQYVGPHLKRELFAKAKYPTSRIVKSGIDLIVISAEKGNTILIGDSNQERLLEPVQS